MSDIIMVALEKNQGHANEMIKEINKNIFPVRAHGGKDAGKMNIDDFIQFIKEKTSETIKEF
jgi:Mg/Co/Ni transporter MgtE